MSIVRMKRMRLLALRDDKQAIMHRLMRLGCVEISEPDARLSDEQWSALVVPAQSDLPGLKAELNILQAAKNTLSKYGGTKKGLFTMRPAVKESEFYSQETLDKTMEAAERINFISQEISQVYAGIGRENNRISALDPWKQLDVPLETSSSEHCRMLFGVCPASLELEPFKRQLYENAPACEFALSDSDREQHYFFLMYHTDESDVVDEILKSVGFSHVDFKEVTGTAAENIALSRDKIKSLEGQNELLKTEIAEFSGTADLLDRCIDLVGTRADRADAADNLLVTDSAFYFEGWAPERDLSTIERSLGDFACFAEFSDPQEQEEVPVLLQNSPAVKPMNMVTEMYSLPKYDHVDPNPLIFPFFTIFFGIMYADVGYGLIMIALSLLGLKKLKPRGTMEYLIKLLGICGMTTLVFGFLFGGYFGDAVNVIAKNFFNSDFTLGAPSFFFSPLEQPMTMMIFSLVLGGIQIVTGMLIKAYLLVRDGKPLDALMDVGSWFVVFAGIAVLAAGSGAWLLIAGAAALLLTQGRNSKSIGGKIIGGLASWYDITSYLSDILSYLRLMALCMATTVIANVVNTLGVMTGAFGFIIVFIIGHLFNMAINIIGTYVHAARLQYLEYFSKFYEQGGSPFRPLQIRTKYTDVIKEENVNGISA